MTLEATATMDAASASVHRGMNSDRLTLLGVLAGIALTIALGVSGIPWMARLPVSFAAFFGVATLLHLLFASERRVHHVMRFAHWVLGRRA